MADKVARKRQAIQPTIREIETIRSCTMLGMSLGAVADELAIDPDTLRKWVNKYPSVKAALQAGRAKRRKRAYACFYEQAFPLDQDGKPTRKGDPSLMIFWMKTRERWKEAKDVEKENRDSDTQQFQFIFKDKEPKKENQ